MNRSKRYLQTVLEVYFGWILLVDRGGDVSSRPKLGADVGWVLLVDNDGDDDGDDGSWVFVLFCLRVNRSKLSLRIVLEANVEWVVLVDVGGDDSGDNGSWVLVMRYSCVECVRGCV